MQFERGLATWRNRLYTSFVLPFLTSGNSQNRGLGRRLVLYEGRERLSLEANKKLQAEALHELAVHAYGSSPFYRRRFDEAGLQPRDLTSVSALVRLPVLVREELRNHLNDIVSDRFPREQLLAAATGGTTDTPVPLFRNAESLQEKTAIQWRFNEWAGLRPGDKVLYLWGAQVDYAQNPSLRWRLYERHLLRRVFLPTSLMNPDVLESYRRTLNDFRPRAIFCYPSPLALFCEYLRDCGKPFHRPASVICTAEALTAQQRQTIEEVLECPAFEHYGTRDFGMVAAECERHIGLHVNPAAVLLEFVPIPGAEVEGLHEILVTDLLNYGMLLIRYKINDCTVLGTEVCPCGRGYPLMGRIIGRTMDLFYMPNGDVVPGISLQNRIIKVCPGIRKMQVIQEEVGRFRIRYVPGSMFSGGDLDMLRATLGKFFPYDLEWTFEPVEEIPREKSGKTRFCISSVAYSTHKQNASSKATA